VRLGDTIRVEGRVSEVRPVDDGAGLVAVQLTIVGAAQQTVARATVEVLWRRDTEREDGAVSGAELADALTCVPL
jgi:acyl dehydratase